MIKNSRFNQNSKFKIQNFKINFPKLLTILFLLIFILQLGSLLILIALPRPSQAIEFIPQVGVPGGEKGFGPGEKYTFSKEGSTAPIAEYIRTIYRFAIGIVGILAAVVLMVGGVLWIVAGGSATQIGEAKAWIGAALTGLVLALTSYLILATVNPALVDLQVTKISNVSELKVGCCATKDEKGNTTDNSYVAQNDCKAPSIWKQGDCPAKSCCSWVDVRSGIKSCNDQGTISVPDCMNQPNYISSANNGKCNSNNECAAIGANGTLSGSCEKIDLTTRQTTCKDNLTKEQCGEGFIAGGKCPLGSCTTVDPLDPNPKTSYKCQDYVTQEKCKGEFVKGGECPGCCAFSHNLGSGTGMYANCKDDGSISRKVCIQDKSGSFLENGICNKQSSLIFGSVGYQCKSK